MTHTEANAYLLNNGWTYKTDSKTWVAHVRGYELEVCIITPPCEDPDDDNEPEWNDNDMDKIHTMVMCHPRIGDLESIAEGCGVVDVVKRAMDVITIATK